MGASPFWYFVDYQPDIRKALHELRSREFQAGRYNPVMPFPPFPIDSNSPAPGNKHDSIEDAMGDADADGTRSILDILDIGDEPDFCLAAPLEDELLEELYGTTQPTRAMIEANDEFLEDVERGHGVYIIAYEQGEPKEIYFAGYSFD
jgi:hypothetical protein